MSRKGIESLIFFLQPIWIDTSARHLTELSQRLGEQNAEDDVALIRSSCLKSSLRTQMQSPPSTFPRRSRLTVRPASTAI